MQTASHKTPAPPPAGSLPGEHTRPKKTRLRLLPLALLTLLSGSGGVRIASDRPRSANSLLQNVQPSGLAPTARGALSRIMDGLYQSLLRRAIPEAQKLPAEPKVRVYRKDALESFSVSVQAGASPKATTIFVSSGMEQLPLQQQTFALAHELGHLVEAENPVLRYNFDSRATDAATHLQASIRQDELRCGGDSDKLAAYAQELLADQLALRLTHDPDGAVALFENDEMTRNHRLAHAVAAEIAGEAKSHRTLSANRLRYIKEAERFKQASNEDESIHPGDAVRIEAARFVGGQLKEQGLLVEDDTSGSAKPVALHTVVPSTGKIADKGHS